MLTRDKSPLGRSCSRLLAAAVMLLLIAGCNRMMTPPTRQVLKDAEAKANSGDYIEAIGLYETALDGSPASADIHYRLALLYDDKMSDPLNALHHFKRYLTVAPTGPKAEEVKKFMQRDEVALLTTLSGDALVTRAEAARLRNENLNLRKQLEERTAQLRTLAQTPEKPARAKRAEKAPTPSKRKKS
jgi:tetratricopeptide (TPR) repeat protein